MAKQVINIGTAPNTGTGDPIRTAFTKTNNNFTELYNQTAATQAQLDGLPPIATDVSELTDTENILGGISNALQNDGHVVELDTEGTLFVPNDLVLQTGTIRDSEGNDLLTDQDVTPSTIRGFTNLIGERPNNQDDAFFESVVVVGRYAYALGGDYYINNSSDRSKVYKFDLETGEQVWVKQITAGRDARFTLSFSAGVVTLDTVDAPGVGYKVNQEIRLSGWQFEAAQPLNDVTIIVNTIDEDGGVLTASIKPGYNVDGIGGTATNVGSPYEGVQGDQVAISYSEHAGKLVVVTEYNAGLGDVMDNFWTWGNVYLMDPDTGAISQTYSLTEEGDIYPNSVATYDAANKIAVVGEKYNDYREFGTLTMLNTGNGYFDILKTELDAEHYPGAPYNYYGDFWITGTGITGQENVDDINLYSDLVTTAAQGTGTGVGTGSAFSIRVNDDGTYSIHGMSNSGQNYSIGNILTIAGTNFVGGTSPANDVTITVEDVDGNGSIISYSTASGTASTTGLRVIVNGVDFTVGGGEWSMRQNLGGEAFIWTPAWSNAIGGPSGDRFYDVCWNENGTALYAVGRGVYEVAYDQALVVKFNATNGSVIWSKDIKFSEAEASNRAARAVCMVPNSTDILVAGVWNNDAVGQTEIILTRMTSAGAAVWQRTYYNEGQWIDSEMSLNVTTDGIVVNFDQGTIDGGGMGYLIVNPANGLVVRHRALSSDGNGNYVYYNTPSSKFADVYSGFHGDNIVVAGYTYAPTDNYSNALLVSLPLNGLKDIGINERLSLGESILTRHDWTVTVVTSAFDSFTPTEHVGTILTVQNDQNYITRAPDDQFKVWNFKITDDSAGYEQFGDGSKQSFATHIVPQILAANDYWLNPQDSGKHIYFDTENGTVWIPNRDTVTFPVGFTFTVVNTTGNDCWIRTATGEFNRADLKLAGRNISTIDVGIPDSGTGSIVTVMKIKDGYSFDGNDNVDVWIISGPGDLYNND